MSVCVCVFVEGGGLEGGRLASGCATSKGPAALARSADSRSLWEAGGEEVRDRVRVGE